MGSNLPPTSWALSLVSSSKGRRPWHAMKVRGGTVSGQDVCELNQKDLGSSPDSDLLLAV